jgi:hypothetical protein
MDFLNNLKQSIKDSSEKDRMVREKIKEIEFKERMKQAEVIAKARIQAKVDKKIAGFNKTPGDKKKEGGFFNMGKPKEEGTFNFMTGKFDKKEEVKPEPSRKKIKIKRKKVYVMLQKNG